MISVPMMRPVCHAMQPLDGTLLEEILQIQRQTPLQPEKNLYCAVCKQRITHVIHAIVCEGSHTHVFTNPVGRVFEIGCFAEAAGCRRAGELILDYSWFHGFYWCYAVCGHCHTHLGWYYHDLQDKSFYGLILKLLCEGGMSNEL